MSHNFPYNINPPRLRLPVIVHDHDVLCGRGVNIAQHRGNERFRTLVTTRADENYCSAYSASEKKAVAEEIIKHIKSLDPPGRFLRRDGRGQSSRGLSGPWEELNERDAIKKTCQALRDCNREDRQGYADGVAMPGDVLQNAEQRAQLGLSGKELAAAAAAAYASDYAIEQDEGIPSYKRPRDFCFDPSSYGRVSPSVENAAEWLKKQRTDDAMATAAAAAQVAAEGEFANNGYDDAQVAAAAAAVYNPNELLAPASAAYNPNELLAPASAATELEEGASESDDPNGNGYHHNPYQLLPPDGGLNMHDL
jgi:hypothetical protein